MKEDPFAGVYRALSPKELAEMFMNPHAPKTEPEHWAVREIETLRAEVDRLRAALQEATLAAHACAQCRDEIGRICREALKYVSMNACDECDVSRQIARAALEAKS